jgi:hypothetical protein
MIVITISGPAKEVPKVAAQVQTLFQTAGKVVRAYDFGVDPMGLADIIIIRKPEAA